MYEQASERWSPVQSVEKVILSVISMLAGMSFAPFSLLFRGAMARAHPLPFLHQILPSTDNPLEPNLESGANIDCCKLYRDNIAVRGFDALCIPVAAGLMTYYRSMNVLFENRSRSS